MKPIAPAAELARRLPEREVLDQVGAGDPDAHLTFGAACHLRKGVPHVRPSPTPELTVAERELARIEPGRLSEFDRRSRVADARFMPEPSLSPSRRVPRRGAELASDVDARSWLAIVAPARSAAADPVGEDLELGDRGASDVRRCRGRPPNVACCTLGAFSACMADAYKPGLWPARTGLGGSRP